MWLRLMLLFSQSVIFPQNQQFHNRSLIGGCTAIRYCGIQVPLTVGQLIGLPLVCMCLLAARVCWTPRFTFHKLLQSFVVSFSLLSVFFFFFFLQYAFAFAWECHARVWAKCHSVFLATGVGIIVFMRMGMLCGRWQTESPHSVK